MTKKQIIENFEKSFKYLYSPNFATVRDFPKVKEFLSSSLDSAIEAVRVENKDIEESAGDIVTETEKVLNWYLDAGYNRCVSLQDEKIKKFRE